MKTEKYEHIDRWRDIIALATPVVISKLSFTAMGLVDTAMVGRLGASEQGAVGIATTYMFTLYVFGLGLVSVVNTFVSQNHGAGRPKMCGVVLGHGLRIATVMGAFTYILLLASKPLFGWAGLSDPVSEAGYAYLFFRILGLPGVFWYWAYNGFLEGLGETRAPMWISLAANIINAGLDYVLIFGLGPIPAFGVEGAGMATAGSNIFMLICFMVVVHRPNSYYRKFGIDKIWSSLQPHLMRKMIKVGWPMGVQFFMEIGAFLVFSVMIGWVGDRELAANQVTLRLMSISFMTAWGISIAATTLVGRHQGEKRSDLASRAGNRTIILALGFALACALLFVSIPQILAGLFTPFEDVARMAAVLMYVAAIMQVFDGLSIVAYGALKGAGDTRWPLWIVISMNWCFGVPLVYYLTIGIKWGVLGAWIGMAAMLASQSMFMLIRFYSGKWKTMKIVDSAS